MGTIFVGTIYVGTIFVGTIFVDTSIVEQALSGWPWLWKHGVKVPDSFGLDVGLPN